MKIRPLILLALLGVALTTVAALVATNWPAVRADYALVRSDWAVSRAKSWRMRLQTTDSRFPTEWTVIEAIPPNREHGWQRVDHDVPDLKYIAGNLEYIRIGDDRYFRGDAMFGHRAAPQWVKLIPRDFPPLGGPFDLRLHLTNPRTIGYSFDSVETSLWSIFHNLQMRPVGLKNYAGHTCLEWTYTWRVKETGQPINDSLCIGTSDHLPYHLTTGGGGEEATYEWNPSVSVDAPKPLVPRPKDFIVADVQ